MACVGVSLAHGVYRQIVILDKHALIVNPLIRTRTSNQDRISRYKLIP